MLDFTKKRQNYLKIKMKNNMILEIKTPTGKELIKLEELGEEKTSKSLMESIRVMINNNKQSKKFSMDDIATMFDIEDMQELAESYALWIKEISHNPN